MASKYLKAAIPTYEPGYVPLPLDFINQKITGDQGKFDNAVAQVAALNALNQQVAPWDKGKEQELLGQYIPKINELSDTLYKTGQVGQIVPQIAKLQQQWQNDPTRKYLQQGFDWYTQSYEPRMKSEGYSTAYDELKDEKGNWNSNINNYQLGQYAYVESDKDAWLDKELDNLRSSKIQQVTNAGGKSWQDPATGLWMYQEPGSASVETLDMSNPYIANGINNITQNIYNGEGNAAKWYKGKYKDKDAIGKYVTNQASTRFFKNTSEAAGNQGIVPGQGGGGAGSSALGTDFMPISSPISTSGFDSNSFKNMMNNRKGLMDANRELIDGEGTNLFYKLATDVGLMPSFQEFIKNNPNTTKVQIVNEWWPKIIEAANDPSVNFDDNTRRNINANLSSFNTTMEKYYQNNAKIDYYNQLDNVITDQSVTPSNVAELKKLMPAASDNEVKIILQSLLNGDLTLSKESKIVDQYSTKEVGSFGVLNKNNTRLNDIVTKYGLDRERDNPSKIFKIMDDVSKNKSKNLNEGKINIGTNAITITNVGKDNDTQSEILYKSLNEHFKDLGGVDNIAVSLGYDNINEMAKDAVTSDLKNNTDLKSYSFKNISFINRGTKPMAAYTFTGTKEGKTGTFTVVAPLITKGNREQVSTIAQEIYLKGLTDSKYSYMKDDAGIMFASANLDDIDQGKIETILRYKPKQGDAPLVYNVGLNDEMQIISTSDANGNAQIMMSVPGLIDMPVSIKNESDITNFIGQIYLRQFVNDMGTGGIGGTSMGKSNQGISILQ